MDANIRFELKAAAFEVMERMLAPGKDAKYGPSSETRSRIWEEWCVENSSVISAFMTAIDRVLSPEEPESSPEPASRESQKDGASLHSGDDSSTFVAVEYDGSRWVSEDDFKGLKAINARIAIERDQWKNSYLQMCTSLSKDYASTKESK
jgi:hypothetical protein